GVERAELHAQHGRVHLVEPAVAAVERVLVLLHLPVRAEVLHPYGDLWTVGADDARIAVRGQVLHDAEAERADGSEGADAPPVERRTVRMRAVLDHDEPSLARQRQHGPQIDG